MKLIIISVPNDIDVNDIRHACTEFAETLALSEIKVNVLDESDIKVESAQQIVTPILKNIIDNCANPNPLYTVANFWRLVSTGQISKGTLEKLIVHRNATKAYLKNKKLECFLSLFDDALKRM